MQVISERIARVQARHLLFVEGRIYHKLGGREVNVITDETPANFARQSHLDIVQRTLVNLVAIGQTVDLE